MIDRCLCKDCDHILVQSLCQQVAELEARIKDEEEETQNWRTAFATQESSLRTAKEALQLIWHEIRRDDLSGLTRDMVKTVLFDKPVSTLEPSKQEALREAVIEAARDLRATFPSSHIWQHEQCLLDVALQDLDALRQSKEGKG